MVKEGEAKKSIAPPSSTVGTKGKASVHHNTIVASDPRPTGSVARNRTISDSDGNTDKRQRTSSLSTQYMVVSSLAGSSPPKFVSLEEIMQAANSMRDMALVHQIVVDDDFRLQKAEPENQLEKAIKETMHKAFWDILKQELSEKPPKYTQALVLLEDVKEGLFSLLLPQHTKIRSQISEVLDSDLIKQQAEKGTIEFPHYAQYVISVMAKLCAPVRDEKINELTKMTDTVEIFKGILETLDLMKLDMANFTIQMARPNIIACSVELERKKFADFLAIQSDGLAVTREWLLKHIPEKTALPPNANYEAFIKSTLKTAFYAACPELLEIEENQPYPETFMIDEDRLKDLQVKSKRVILVGTILLVTLSNVGAELQALQAFKTTIKEHSSVLAETYVTNADLEKIIPNMAEQVLKDVRTTRKEQKLEGLSKEQETLIKTQILEIKDPEHKIRNLVRTRVMEFFSQIIESSTADPQKVPTGLSAFQKEITNIAGQFLKIVTHNCTVFAPYYYDLVAAKIPKPT